MPCSEQMKHRIGAAMRLAIATEDDMPDGKISRTSFMGGILILQRVLALVASSATNLGTSSSWIFQTIPLNSCAAQCHRLRAVSGTHLKSVVFQCRLSATVCIVCARHRAMTSLASFRAFRATDSCGNLPKTALICPNMQVWKHGLLRPRPV